MLSVACDAIFFNLLHTASEAFLISSSDTKSSCLIDLIDFLISLSMRTAMSSSFIFSLNAKSMKDSVVRHILLSLGFNPNTGLANIEIPIIG